MDIFAWLYDTRMPALREEAPRLARILYRLPTAAVDNRHAEVDALAAEGLGLARARKDIWLEIYLRHWRLQSRVFKRLEVKDSLRDAVDLVERAHRPDAIGCPQSTCATQDLCAAYGRADGPAYVAERMAASESTLARIDPSWPCWRCISAEYAGALVDAGRHAEALAWLEDSVRTLRTVRPKARRDEYVGTWVDCLVNLDQIDAALKMNAEAVNDGHGEHFVHERAIEKAWILLRADRPAEAAACLPAWAVIHDTPDYYARWAEVLCGLASCGQITFETEHLHQLLQMVRALADSGAAWLAFQVGTRTIETLITVGWLPPADALIDELAAVADARREPARSHAERADLRARWQAAVAAWTPPAPEGDGPPVGVPPAVALMARLQALAAQPGDVAGARAVSALWGQLGFPARAEATVRMALDHSPGADGLVLELGERLLGRGALDDLEALISAHCGPTQPVATQRVGLWFTGRARAARGDRAGAIKALRALWAADQSRPGVALLLVGWLKDAADLAGGLAVLDEALAAGASPGPVDWARIGLATRLGEWAVVRESGARLGMTFSADLGPVEEDWGYVRVAFPDEGDEATYVAVRTGPVTARVIQTAYDERPQHEDDVVVFDPAPRNPQAADGELYEFVADTVLSEGNRVGYAIDGVEPSAAVLSKVVDALAPLGARLHRLSGPDYRVRTDSGQRKGLYAVVTAPAALPKVALAAVLQATLGRSRMTWLSLLGDEDTPVRRRQLNLAQVLDL